MKQSEGGSKKKILITGGTVFVSKYAAKYYVQKGDEVYVLNRNTKKQVEGVHLIEADRNDLGDSLKDYDFDVVLDITAYNKADICNLVQSLGSFGQYIMISSSAVYPETDPQPFIENGVLGPNTFWGQYGTDKIEAEKTLLKMVPNAYILRPPYLYGPMNNVYREAFVFECAMRNRAFWLPKDGSMKLQFFHVKDLCKLMDVMINNKPSEHILNVGNAEAVSIKDWVWKCYACFNKVPSFVNVYDDIEQRNYFSFYNYEYYLDVERQHKIYSETIPLEEGLREAAEWYLANEAEVNKKPYFDYIDTKLA
ncbi:MAG: NAD-dependent epimerase/dehydratase family protein [Lachnospiraceae bacterium]|nr:NAD-dependent epimerase/dehydratase family protein [Lachnospiraceae bacterium]